MASECLVLEFTITRFPLSWSLGPQNRPHSPELSATTNIGSYALQHPEHNKQSVWGALTQFLDSNLNACFIQIIATSLQYCFKLKKHVNLDS